MSFIQFKEVKIDLEADDLKSGAGGGRKFLEPGRYRVTISNVMEPKANNMDPSWQDLGVEVKNEAGQTSMGTIRIPTERLSFNMPKGPVNWEARKFFDTCEALFGSRPDITAPGALRTFLGKKFGDTRKLKGLSCEVEVGYDKGRYYAVRKNKVVVLTNGDATIPNEFSTFDDAAAYADQQGLKYQKFSRVLAFKAAPKAPAAQAEDDEPV